MQELEHDELEAIYPLIIEIEIYLIFFYLLVCRFLPNDITSCLHLVSLAYRDSSVKD